MRLTRFGTVDLPPTDLADNFQTSARSSLVTLQNGSFDQDGAATVLQPGRISRRTTLHAAYGTDLDATYDALMREMSKGRRILRATMRDGTERVTPCKLTQVGRDVNTDVYECDQPITLSWVQDFPFWIAGDDVWYLDDGETLDSGLVLDENYSQAVLTTTSTTLTINNAGTARLYRGYIMIVPQAGASITNPRIFNPANQMSLQVNATITAPGNFTAEFGTKSARVDGVAAYTLLTIGTAQADWMILEIGDNPIEITATAISGTVDLYWSYQRHYL